MGLEAFFAHLGLGLNVLLTGTSNGRCWIDQTPANTLVVDRLAEMFPGARFLHILRDGRRVVHSMINFHSAMGDPKAVQRMRDAGRLPPWTTDFGDACRTWTRFVRIAADFGRRNPDRTHTLTNEGLITDPEDTMRGVLDFLGVPQEPGPARFLRENRINSSFAASGRSAQAPPALSEPWRDWLPEQREAFLENAGETMIDAGSPPRPSYAPAWTRLTAGRVTAPGGVRLEGERVREIRDLALGARGLRSALETSPEVMELVLQQSGAVGKDDPAGLAEARLVARTAGLAVEAGLTACELGGEAVLPARLMVPGRGIPENFAEPRTVPLRATSAAWPPWNCAGFIHCDVPCGRTGRPR